MRISTDLDDKIMLLRGEGRSYGSIARVVGLETPTEAYLAFLHALEALPNDEREEIRQAERDRLDRFADRIRARCVAKRTDPSHQLALIRQMRAQLRG